MKLITPFTNLARKLNEMDLIRNAMKVKEQSATERFHDNYRKMIWKVFKFNEIKSF